MCGMSKGARVALGVANHAPSLVGKLIVVNAFVNLTLSDKVARIALYDLLGRDDGGRMWAESLLREMGITNDIRDCTRPYPIAHADRSAPYPELVRRTHTAPAPILVDPLKSQHTAFQGAETRSSMINAVNSPPYNAPTLIVRGSHDNFVPEYCALELHRLIAGSELVCLNGCGHLPYLEDPALFNRIVEQFIGRK
jgi:sigma-B regulation protein RsbQ